MTSAADLSLPPAWTPPARAPIPIVASIVPVMGAVVLWLVLGSPMALWLAALGPLVAAASILDSARSARSGRRRATADAARARERVASAVGAEHDLERERRWTQHPDVARFAVRDADVWRAVPARADVLVVGAGETPSELRVTGGEGDPASLALRARAAVLPEAPVTVPIAAGLAIAGPAVLAAAVARGLVLQACLALPPGRLRIVGADRADEAWVGMLPHRAAATGTGLALVGPGEQPPPDADIVIARTDGTTVPPRCAAVLTVQTPHAARLDHAGEVRELAIEAIGVAQAEAIAARLAERAERVLGRDAEADAVLFADLPTARPRRGGLPAALGRGGGQAAVVDLVADGPHAVVAGVTGAGKSELLITWVLALCAAHSTREVSFLLADFKGGTAFDALAALPHVTGVITDLDGTGARRALDSLRAEVRWRESELTRAGARDVLDERVDLPRLVIVVDEFAALLVEHPELNAVFADVAARGRALGMHLILGTQRVSGVVRDALLANCPLRVSLRVTDAADSRLVVGTDEAATLPGGAAAAGVALVRRGQDAAPQRVRIALSEPGDIPRIAATASGPAPRRPWLPALPARITLAELQTLAATGSHNVGDSRFLGADRAARSEEVQIPEEVRIPEEARARGPWLLGLADEPERQRQVPFVLDAAERGLLVVGGAASGKSTALETLAAETRGPIVRVPRDGEAAWDALTALDEAPAGTLVVIDDLDTLAIRLPADYGHAALDIVERLVRGTGETGVFVAAAAQRLTGAVARIAELVPRRLVLATASRAEHVALGGDAAHYIAGAPPGRGRWGATAVQVAIAGDPVRLASADVPPWHPGPGITGLVGRAASLRDVGWAGVRVMTVDEAPSDLAALAGPRGRIVIVGDPDQWQRAWRVLTALRDEHTLVIDAACAAEYRVLAGDRSLPPYCTPGRRRAWLIRAGRPAIRARVPARDEPVPRTRAAARTIGAARRGA